MKNYYVRFNVWCKIGIFTIMLLFALAFADSELYLIDWFDDVEQWLGIAILFETVSAFIECVIGTIRTIADKVRGTKKEES